VAQKSIDFEKYMLLSGVSSIMMGWICSRLSGNLLRLQMDKRRSLQSIPYGFFNFKNHLVKGLIRIHFIDGCFLKL